MSGELIPIVGILLGLLLMVGGFAFVAVLATVSLSRQLLYSLRKLRKAWADGGRTDDFQRDRERL